MSSSCNFVKFLFSFVKLQSEVLKLNTVEIKHYNFFYIRWYKMFDIGWLYFLILFYLVCLKKINTIKIARANFTTLVIFNVVVFLSYVKSLF